MVLELDTASDLNLLNDIDKCISCERTDKKLLLFLHISVQIKDEIKKLIEVTFEKEIISLESYERFCENQMKEFEFTNWCDLHYGLLSNQEEARIYLNTKKNDTEEYILNEKMYMRIKRIDVLIAKFLGLLKAQIKSSSTSITNNFHT